MRVRVWCFSLAENQFRSAILANYYQKMPGVPGQKLHFFQFELDHAQTHVLMEMFTPLPPPNNFWKPSAAAPADEHVSELISSPVWAPECERNNDLKSEKVVKSYADMVSKNKFEEVGTGDVDVEHASSGNVSSNGFDDLDCGDTPLDREECALSDKVVELQPHQQSGQQEKVLSFNWEFPRHKMLSPQRWTSEFCANATETKDNDAHSCRYAQEVKYTILDGHSNLPETLDAELDQLSWGHSSLLVQLLDSESCTEAKVRTSYLADRVISCCCPWFVSLFHSILLTCLVLYIDSKFLTWFLFVQLIEVVKELSKRIEVMEKKQVSSEML